jgi:hypothetical protein
MFLKILKHLIDILLTSRSDINYDQAGRWIQGGNSGNSLITFKGKPHQADSFSINPVIALNGLQKRSSLFPVHVHLKKHTTEDEFKSDQQKENFQKIKESCGMVGIKFTREFDATGTIYARNINRTLFRWRKRCFQLIV